MSNVFITANVISDFLSPVISLFDKVLVAIHSVVGSWGWSIVAMTVLIRALLIPLTLKSIRSQNAMKEFAPQIKAMQEKYKDDKPKLNEEMMKFYRENQINPFASCLPLLAQAPVFISLFYLLQQDLKPHICPSIESYAASLHKSVSQVTCGEVPGATGQSFLFIPDLTAKATGAVLVTLIVLYVGSQLTSTLVMMQPTMDKTQRYIMFGLPLFFVVFVINFPAGLLVYWITTNLWTVGQSVVVKKTSPPLTLAGDPGAALATKPKTPSDSAGKRKSGGLMNRLLEASAAAQEEANARKKEAAGASGSTAKGAKKSDHGKPQAAKKPQGSDTSGDQERSKPEDSSAKSKSGPPPQRNKRKRTGRRR